MFSPVSFFPLQLWIKQAPPGISRAFSCSLRPRSLQWQTKKGFACWGGQAGLTQGVLQGALLALSCLAPGVALVALSHPGPVQPGPRCAHPSTPWAATFTCSPLISSAIICVTLSRVPALFCILSWRAEGKMDGEAEGD